jgi:hypothetical protein
MNSPSKLGNVCWFCCSCPSRELLFEANFLGVTIYCSIEAMSLLGCCLLGLAYPMRMLLGLVMRMVHVLCVDMPCLVIKQTKFCLYIYVVWVSWC